MNDPIRRGTLEMTSAMLICGTIGWLVLLSGQPVLDVVFWRCVFGFATLLVACAALGFLRRGSLGREAFLLALLSGVFIVGNWVLLFASYSRASIAIGTAVYNVQPFMLVGLGAAFSARRSRRASWAGWGFRSPACWRSSTPTATAAPRAGTTCSVSSWRSLPRCCMPLPR